MAYQSILRVYKGFSGGGWPRAWRGVRVADMGGRTTPLRSPYKPGQVPHSAHTRLKSQQAAFPLGEEVRISRLGLKPAPRSEKADIGSTENSTDIRRIKTSWLRPRAHAPSTCAISAEKSAPLAHSPMYFFYRNYWFQTKNAGQGRGAGVGASVRAVLTAGRLAVSGGAGGAGQRERGKRRCGGRA